MGYVEGGNLTIERYSADGHHERYAGIAREIVMRRPDVIVTGTNPVVTAFNTETRTIPVVAFMLDPLHAGLVTNPAGLAVTSPVSPSILVSKSGASAWKS